MHLLCYFFTVCFTISGTSLLQARLEHWDWRAVDLNAITLPSIMGTSVSEYQVSGAHNCPHSNWAHWEGKKIHNGRPTIQGNDWSGSACNFWHSCYQDIALIKQLGCNSFRFSIEWSNIEPQEGQFCQEAINHYRDFCVGLRHAGIEPMITLHHFTHPHWFEQKGGFANAENIHYFVRFCERVFTQLSSQVTLWCTINEIGPFVFQGYIQGVFPPGLSGDLWTALNVMRTMMQAHCAVYKALKALPGGDKAQIGLVHQYLTIESHTTSYMQPALQMLGTYAAGATLWSMWASLVPKTTKFRTSWALGVAALGALNPVERIPAWFMTYIFNDALMHFLKTGTVFPFIPGLRLTIADGRDCCDFIGLNFYSRVVIESRLIAYVLSGGVGECAFPHCRQGELMTDMEYGVCPEGLYAAIKDMSQFGKPIYITENGVADKHDDIRALWIKRYLYAVSKALADGYDVRGYYYWSLMDNFEWDRGYGQRFGLYEVDRITQQRRLRHSAQCYAEAIERQR